MKIKVIDKGNGKEKIKDIRPLDFIERIKGTYAFAKTAQEEFWAGRTKQVETPFFIYQLVKALDQKKYKDNTKRLRKKYPGKSLKGIY